MTDIAFMPKVLHFEQYQRATFNLQEIYKTYAGIKSSFKSGIYRRTVHVHNTLADSVAGKQQMIYSCVKAKS